MIFDGVFVRQAVRLNRLTSPTECQCAVSVGRGQPTVTEMQQHSGCLTLLEIYWNNFSLLEIYWKLAKSLGNFLGESKFLYFTVYQ